MRIFVIVDASKRKAKPIGIVTWQARPAGGPGAFSLELCSSRNQHDLPLSLSFCCNREGRVATPEESERWVRSRIVPENRHNIVEVLRANGLSEYDEASLLAASKGRSSDDDLLVYEVSAPADLLEELGFGTGDGVSGEGKPRADRAIDAFERLRSGGEYHYGFVSLSHQGISEGDDERSRLRATAPENAAHRIGGQIRQARKRAGLTQTQLAAKAGITQSVLSRVESGNGNPTLSLLEDIAAALGMRMGVRLERDNADGTIMP